MPPSMRNPGRKVEPINKEAEGPPFDFSHFGGSEEVGQFLQGPAITPDCETSDATNAIVTEFLRSKIDLF